MFVILKILNNPSSVTFELIYKIAVPYKVHGITQDSETRNYMVVLDFNKCGKCNNIRLCSWNDKNQDWDRKNQKMIVILKILNNPSSITLEFINKIAVPHEVYGITQDPETKNYMIVLNDICEKYFINKIAVSYKVRGITQDPETRNYMVVLDFNKCGKCDVTCNSIHFQQNFKNWASEWIPYDRLYDIKYIAKGGNDQNMVVALKSLNNSRNITLEFMNEITLHHKRPNAIEIKKTLSQWFRESFESQDNSEYYIDSHSEIRKQINEAKIINNMLQTSSALSINLGISYETHSEAIYTSRLLNFCSLPEPVNSNDYYKVEDNIISMESLESLQIDISQLENNNFNEENSNDNIKMKSSESLQIDNNNFPEPNNSYVSYKKIDDLISMNSSESLQIDISQLNISNDDQDSKSKGKEKI
ncbi:kinase-like domain-containing protein [Rhizophagus irregularis DAOM 181602=DAOM 197198]|nr:kinase-like domain-containing protein [Rhizophagus irregularis DAOM 181602=DAOM 197198]